MPGGKEQLERLIKVLEDAAKYCRDQAQGSRLAADAYGDDEEASTELRASAIEEDNLAERLETEAELLKTYGL